GAQAGLAGNVNKPGSVLLGSPVIEISRFRRIIAIFNNLDKLYSRIGELEKNLKQLQSERIADQKTAN
ncbi:MAG: hypothetical protein U0Z17_10975, partial [Bacteroidales bacterium]